MPDVLDEPSAPPENANPTPTDPAATEDAALILAYTQETNIPAPLEKWYRSFDSDRKYVNNDCMALDAQDAVGTNHILRNQYTLMAMLNSRDADIRVDIEDAVWQPEPEYATDMMTGLPQIDPMTGMPAIIGELPGSAPPELVKLARTSEVLAKRLLKSRASVSNLPAPSRTSRRTPSCSSR